MSTRKAKTYLPKPTKGALGSYTTTQPAAARHRALERSVSAKGYKSTMLDLNLRATLNKNKAPVASKKMRSDMEYLRKSHGRKSHKSRR